MKQLSSKGRPAPQIHVSKTVAQARLRASHHTNSFAQIIVSGARCLLRPVLLQRSLHTHKTSSPAPWTPCPGEIHIHLLVCTAAELQHQNAAATFVYICALCTQ
jgi:hypothetical protein